MVDKLPDLLMKSSLDGPALIGEQGIFTPQRPQYGAQLNQNNLNTLNQRDFDLHQMTPSYNNYP
jgi:hypothetical protein